MFLNAWSGEDDGGQQVSNSNHPTQPLVQQHPQQLNNIGPSGSVPMGFNGVDSGLSGYNSALNLSHDGSASSSSTMNHMNNNFMGYPTDVQNQQAQQQQQQFPVPMGVFQVQIHFTYFRYFIW